MEISCMISSTSSSAFSTSITLIATDCPVRLSTLRQVSRGLKLFSTELGRKSTLCRPCQSCHRLYLVSIVLRKGKARGQTYAILFGIQRLRIHHAAHHTT